MDCGGDEDHKAAKKQSRGTWSLAAQSLPGRWSHPCLPPASRTRPLLLLSLLSSPCFTCFGRRPILSSPQFSPHVRSRPRLQPARVAAANICRLERAVSSRGLFAPFAFAVWRPRRASLARRPYEPLRVLLLLLLLARRTGAMPVARLQSACRLAAPSTSDFCSHFPHRPAKISRTMLQ